MVSGGFLAAREKPYNILVMDGHFETFTATKNLEDALLLPIRHAACLLEIVISPTW